MTLDRIDCISWFHLNASYVLGNKIAKNRDSTFNDLGKPQFFYEVVQYWVAFELVQVLQKFGLNPKFKTNIDKWSKDLHCVVQFFQKKHNKIMTRNEPKYALTSFSNQKKQNTTDHSYVVNMAQKQISRI